MIIRLARPDDATAIAQVRNEGWQKAYRGIIADSYLDAMSVDEARARIAPGIESPDERFFVAEDGDEVIGFSVAGREREFARPLQGELWSIYVRPGRQRSGVGRRLFQAAVAGLQEMGFRTMLVWTLAGNPSNGFYERMGGRLASSGTFALAGIEYALVAYEWDGLCSLASRV